MSPLLILSAIRTHWRTGLVVIALLFAGLSYVGKLRAERSLEKTLGQLALAAQVIERQNEAVRALERESEERRRAAQRAVAEAQRINRAQLGTIEALRRSAATPREGPCVISDTLRNAEGL